MAAKFLTITTVILLLFCANAIASLSGKVVDQKNNPIVGVSVTTDIVGVGTVTDSNGIFTIEKSDNVTASRVTFSSVGYKPQQFAVNSIPAIVVLTADVYELGGITVRSDRAQSGVSAIAFDNFSSDDIKRDYTVGEFPILLETTPNFYSFADGGSPLGYVYTKIRGFDDKRIVTYINGVPLNDPEDHATYFTDLPDFAANVTDIQVQRGVGNSLYGDASFGGSINIVTSAFDKKRGASLTTGYGAFSTSDDRNPNLYKQSLEYSSGLIDGRWSFSGRFSKQKTGGYRRNSWYEGWSYYFSIGRLDPRMSTELYVYGGPMRMHLSYYGATREDIEADRYTNALTYDNETDNFNQPHYHLHNTYRIDDKKTLTNTFYYIRGVGYYEQYKYGRSFSDYNIDQTLLEIDPSTSEPYEKGDLVRQQHVKKNQLGWNPRLDIGHDKGKHSLGGSFYYFDSDHWGQVVWAQHINGQLPPRNKYYQYFGKKYVSSAFFQEQYQLNERLSLQGAVQVRYQKYKLDQEVIGAFVGHNYNLDWFFLSPRIGLNYKLSERLSLFGNFSVASRTPSDVAIYDANDPEVVPSLDENGDPTARSERVYDFELGGSYQDELYAFDLNLFYMPFEDEIIPYGGINESGVAFTTNAERSVHAGVEFSGKIKTTEYLTLSGNLSYNYNRIKEYKDTISIYANDWSSVRDTVIDFSDKIIPAFPDVLGSLIADFKYNPIRATLRLKYAGKQQMELFNVDSLAIDPFVTASISLSATAENFLGFGNLTLSIKVDNLFDKKYLASGYGWNYGQDNASGQAQWINEAEYYVAPERSFFAQLRLDMF